MRLVSHTEQMRWKVFLYQRSFHRTELQRGHAEVISETAFLFAYYVSVPKLTDIIKSKVQYVRFSGYDLGHT